MPNNRVCKFFAQGGCLKGESCMFSHDHNPPSNNICSFYQKGACSFGTWCRYEHVKVSQSLPSTDHIPAVKDGFSTSSKSLLIPDRPTLAKNPGDGISSNSCVIGKSIKILNPYNNPICSFAAVGKCHRGEFCPDIHGDICPTCETHCLDPYKPQETEEHLKTCNKRRKHLELLIHSQEVECSVCLERVLSKSSRAEQKFGILSECDHPFCISCIRNWRSSSSRVMDVNSVLRACPICRKVSYFIIPSVIWYSTKEEKAEIVDSYKKKLRSIDCKYFEFGNGTCPFGSSCFYKHIVKEGSFLWNAARRPDFCDLSYLICDETDWLSDGGDDEDEEEEEDGLLNMLPQMTLEVEAEDLSFEQDFNNAMASLLLLDLILDGNDLEDDGV